MSLQENLNQSKGAASEEGGAIILAGGRATRLPNKCFRALAGRSLVRYTFDQVALVTRNIVVVTRTSTQATHLKRILPTCMIIQDHLRNQSPLVGFLTGLRAIRAKYVFLTGCDAPYIQPKVVRKLFRLAKGKDCAVPVSADGADPLLAVYHRGNTIRAATRSIKRRRMGMQDMIACLSSPTYVPKAELRKVDPDLLSFQNVNTPHDLQRARRTLKRRLL